MHISSGRMADVTALDLLPIEAGAFYVIDRGYTDFARLYRFTQGLAFFILPAKSNADFTRGASRAVDKSTGLRSDCTMGCPDENAAMFCAWAWEGGRRAWG